MSIEPTDSPAADLVVLGAGIVGLATAYAAARRGLSVLLLERANGPVLGTSFANGAQLSYAYTDAMAGPATWRQLPKMLFGRNGPFRTRWSPDPDFWRWGLAFLRETNARRAQANTLATLELALESRIALHALLQHHPIAFDHVVSGKLRRRTPGVDHAIPQQGVECTDLHLAELVGIGLVLIDREIAARIAEKAKT